MKKPYTTAVVAICCGLAACACLAAWYVASSRSAPSRLVEVVTDPRVVADQLGFDAYFAGLTPCDLAARGAVSRESARAAYLASVMTTDTAGYVAKMEAAEAAGQSRQRRRMRVVVLDDRSAPAPAGIESGWPHTHGDLICMPASYLDRVGLVQLARTLAHERTHVCQRMDPGRCMAPGAGPGAAGRVKVTDFDAQFPDLAARRRSNPDLDGYLYRDDGGWLVVSLFDSEAAAAVGGLAAARVMCVDPSTGRTVSAPRGTYEHPNEAHAYKSESES